MAAEIFQKNERGYFRWLKRHPNGFVLTTVKGISIEYMSLHRATCRMINTYMKNMRYGAFTERGYIKICANSQEELLSWIKKQGGEGFTKKCRLCKPDTNNENNNEYYECIKELENIIESRNLRGKGQGFNITPELRKKIETYSVSKAKKYFEKLGFSVKNVGSTHSYDLECKKSGNILRVEVKGTQSAGESIILTPNEIESARNHETALYILHSISVTQKDQKYKLSGGKELIMNPWKIDKQGKLKSISFIYYLKFRS